MRTKVLILGLICFFLMLCKGAPKSPFSSKLSTNQPTIHYFVADSSEILYGNSTMLSWSVSNATRVSLLPALSEDVPPIGMLEISPVVRTTFTLYAYGTGDIRIHAYVIVEVRSGANLRIIGEPQFTITCLSYLPSWRLGLNITIANVGNKVAGGVMIWCHKYSDPNAVPDENYRHESHMGANGFGISNLQPFSERDFVFARLINENREGNECELVRDGKIVIDLVY